MTDIDDATCTGSSYGSTLVAAGGTGLVAWTKQLSKIIKGIKYTHSSRTLNPYTLTTHSFIYTHIISHTCYTHSVHMHFQHTLFTHICHTHHSLTLFTYTSKTFATITYLIHSLQTLSKHILYYKHPSGTHLTLTLVTYILHTTNFTRLFAYHII